MMLNKAPNGLLDMMDRLMGHAGSGWKVGAMTKDEAF